MGNGTLSQSDKPRVSFVAHLAYGALGGGKNGFIGGIERQQSIMAKWLATRGYRVSMITCDEGQQDGEQIDDVRVFKMCRKDAGIKGLRFFWPKWTSLVAAMKRADADIYYQNCGEYVTGQVALWCRSHGRKFVYSVANDVDCDSKLPEMHTLRERILYRYGLKHADKIIVQTKKQQEMLRDNFGQDSVVIPMPCPGPSEEDYAGLEQQRNGSDSVLWIGRICKQKRPDRLLELAKACPDVHFDLVGPAGDSQYACDICRQVRTITNITYHGPAEREKVSQFYKKAKLMCCTSDYEGFPNTFLEAWSCGLPIVSTFDPDNLIARKNMGAVAQDIKGLALEIRNLLTEEKQWQQASRAARQYYLENHTNEAAMPKFEKIFNEVITPIQDSNYKKREELLCQ
jgi:glycosyltransferase involved in cell wall biosynthesis